MHSASFYKLVDKLKELFQLDQADLDFGVYRIMNMRRDEIIQFLEKDLLPQVQSSFQDYKSSDRAELKKELEEAERHAKAAGIEPEQSPTVQGVLQRYKDAAVDITALENEVYDHLYNFFRRYYSEGDFISQRRYKEGVYAIPYEGEEVKLYWANYDQYYIKTTEYFRDYSFKVDEKRTVHFKILEADTEKDTRKASNGKDRRFFLVDEDAVTANKSDLIIRFEYKTAEGEKNQEKINAATVQLILDALNLDAFASWQHALTKMWKNSKGEEKSTILEKHLGDYTKRNTFDYFIHKNLKRFLRRELDFYIKNEVMHLDDIEEENVSRVEQYLSKIKVIRSIAHKVIEFLSQTEEFQKKLWLKKKFVLETNYCITLDRVPEELYPEIITNKAQHDEWVQLFAIDDIEASTVQHAYSNPLTIEFLKDQPYLVLDTKFFDEEFKNKLLASINGFDEQCDGVLIHSENFQALNLLQTRYKRQVDSVYIDPPYNTDAGPISYKNGYKSSSWISLIEGRLALSSKLLSMTGILCATIDDYQQRELHYLVENQFGKDSLAGTVAIRINPSGRPVPSGFGQSHEYAIFAKATSKGLIGLLPRTDSQNSRYKESDDEGHFMWELFRKRGSNSERKDRPSLYYPIYLDNGNLRIPRMTWDGDNRDWIIHEEPKSRETILYPIDDNGVERTWRWKPDAIQDCPSQLTVKERNGHWVVYYKFRPNQDGVLPLTLWADAKYSATEHGTGTVKKLFHEYNVFSYPKSIFAVQDCISIAGMREVHSVCLDFFAGSGTTAHAVINMNREDSGNRKYILVEMGEYFDTVLKPRIQKVVYSEDWKDGKPVSRKGISHCFKYLKLESYEDALANITLKRTHEQQMAMEMDATFHESYLLQYMLGTESQSSPSLLNTEWFDDPFNYKLLVSAGSVGETKPVNVDLVETFNYLIGLKVDHIRSTQGYRIVEGKNLKGDRILIIWRKIRTLEMTDEAEIANAREEANRKLDEFFRKQSYNTLDTEYDIIYVNGDNNLMNLPLSPDEGQPPAYKVRLIEEEFGRFMFDTKDV